jgi:hypothetical protein
MTLRPHRLGGRESDAALVINYQDTHKKNQESFRVAECKVRPTRKGYFSPERDQTGRNDRGSILDPAFCMLRQITPVDLAKC